MTHVHDWEPNWDDGILCKTRAQAAYEEQGRLW